MVNIPDPTSSPAQNKLPITALVITRNEENAIADCLGSLSFCDQILVIDSYSTDRTAQIAEALGAEVLTFAWNGAYPKKKQWSADHPAVRHDWVFHIDADEMVSPKLAHFLRQYWQENQGSMPDAFIVELAYHFLGSELRHGHTVKKIAILQRQKVRFPSIDDLSAPGVGEVEGHYQPEVKGRLVRAEGKLIHRDPDLLRTWIDRHNRYSDWEAHLLHQGVAEDVRRLRSSGGRLFATLPCKPLLFFIYTYIVKRGFLDGAAGFGYAFALAFYYWLISEKRKELSRMDGTASP